MNTMTNNNTSGGSLLSTIEQYTIDADSMLPITYKFQISSHNY